VCSWFCILIVNAKSVGFPLIRWEFLLQSEGQGDESHEFLGDGVITYMLKVNEQNQYWTIITDPLLLTFAIPMYN
jgi:hypothetical protein